LELKQLSLQAHNTTYTRRKTCNSFKIEKTNTVSSVLGLGAITSWTKSSQVTCQKWKKIKEIKADTKRKKLIAVKTEMRAK
jgi:hypothetical protein